MSLYRHHQLVSSLAGGDDLVGPDSIDDYIASFPPEVQDKLRAVRATIRDAARGTDETISYGIPTFTLDGRYVIYFAGWKRHISVYPVPATDEPLTTELAPYISGRGTLRFPLTEQIPLDLIAAVVRELMNRRQDPLG
jgi:uncharacterized protein YdhG (YjbR/CyaY superfamily)